MKKFILNLVLIFTIILVTEIEVVSSNYDPGFGQEEPCDQYWWPGIPWQNHLFDVIEIDGCFYLVSYWHRSIPTGRQEYQITEMVRLSPPVCNVYRTFDEIKRYAYIQIFEEAGRGFLDSDTLGSPVVIQENVCKREEPYTPNPTGDPTSPFSVDSLFITIPVSDLSSEDSLTISPFIPAPIGGNFTIGIDQYFVFCPDTVCCRAFYQTHWSPYDDHKLDSLYFNMLDDVTYQGPDTCVAQYCEENCGSLKFNYNSYREEPFFYGDPYAKEINEEYLNLDGTMNIWPNPTNGVLNIDINNNALGRSILEVTDLEGHTLVEEFYEKNNESLILKLNLNNFIKGTYFIKYHINGQSIKKKFIVN